MGGCIGEGALARWVPGLIQSLNIGRAGAPPGHRQQCRDVVHHRLDASPDRLKTSQPQQVHRCGSQCGHRAGAITVVAVGILVQLGVADPVPALNAPAVTHQLQQRFWRGAQAGEKEVGGLKGLAVAAASCRHLHDHAGADPGLADVLRGLFGPQRPGDDVAMADLVIRCHKRDLAFSLVLAADLAGKSPLVPLDRQQEVGPLLLELPKNGRWIWSASAWIRTPSRSSSPSSCRSTARSWFSPVA